jgi:hypothetical protein
VSAQYGAALETDRPAEAGASYAAVQEPAAPSWAAAYAGAFHLFGSTPEPAGYQAEMEAGS